MIDFNVERVEGDWETEESLPYKEYTEREERDNCRVCEQETRDLPIQYEYIDKEGGDPEIGRFYKEWIGIIES